MVRHHERSLRKRAVKSRIKKCGDCREDFVALSDQFKICTPCNKTRLYCNCAVGDAIKAGKLARGSCQVCGATEDVEGHHPIYDRSRPLDVEWLCSKHHRDHHKEKTWQNWVEELCDE